ncbi:MAG TPA: hypothetical protein VLZ54_08980 [Arenibacter sp.]|nr:hypothetical protein [Arenibacter sp.]
MLGCHPCKSVSAIFITFSGNCEKALRFYQTCFGGLLQFETLKGEIPGYTGLPVVSGSLISDRVIIHGSDLVHNEGRRIGNYMSIYLACENSDDRRELVKKLESGKRNLFIFNDREPRLIEVTDVFDVGWILGVMQ